MTDISNKFLAFLVFIAISLSTFSTLTLLNRLDLVKESPKEITGKAPIDLGNVSLEVIQDLSIILSVDTVDFGNGFINTSGGKDPSCQINATLSAEATYSDRDDCWTATETPTNLELYNAGNVNVSLTVLGPIKDDFFNNEVTVNTKNITWKFRNNETDACTENVTAALSYRDFDGTAQSICTNLRYIPNEQDSLAIDIQVVIPPDLGVGTYENSTIEFEGTAS